MKVDVPDNGPNIESLEAKPHGVLPLLDEQCRLGERATDTAFSENVNKLNGGCVAAAGGEKAAGCGLWGAGCWLAPESRGFGPRGV